MVSLKIKRGNHLDKDVCIPGPMLTYDIEAKISFYCTFDLSKYPMDTSRCKLRFGGKVSNVMFKLEEYRKRNA